MGRTSSDVLADRANLRGDGLVIKRQYLDREAAMSNKIVSENWRRRLVADIGIVGFISEPALAASCGGENTSRGCDPAQKFSRLASFKEENRANYSC